jgi:tRNA A22 N-methylase
VLGKCIANDLALADAGTDHGYLGHAARSDALQTMLVAHAGT